MLKGYTTQKRLKSSTICGSLTHIAACMAIVVALLPCRWEDSGHHRGEAAAFPAAVVWKWVGTAETGVGASCLLAQRPSPRCPRGCCRG